MIRPLVIAYFLALVLNACVEITIKGVETTEPSLLPTVTTTPVPLAPVDAPDIAPPESRGEGWIKTNN